MPDLLRNFILDDIDEGRTIDGGKKYGIMKPGVPSSFPVNAEACRSKPRDVDEAFYQHGCKFYSINELRQVDAQTAGIHSPGTASASSLNWSYSRIDSSPGSSCNSSMLEGVQLLEGEEKKMDV